MYSNTTWIQILDVKDKIAINPQCSPSFVEGERVVKSPWFTEFFFYPETKQAGAKCTTLPNWMPFCQSSSKTGDHIV